MTRESRSRTGHGPGEVLELGEVLPGEDEMDGNKANHPEL